MPLLSIWHWIRFNEENKSHVGFDFFFFLFFLLLFFFSFFLLNVLSNSMRVQINVASVGRF